MYKKDKKRRSLLFFGGGLAFAICLALILFFIYILVLRTEYRAACLEINDTILATEPGEVTVERGGEQWPLSHDALEYFNMRLLEEQVIVYNRANKELTDESIIIHLGDSTLSFTGYEDGTCINIHWKTPRGLKTYSVRSSVVPFWKDSVYLTTYINSLKNG